MPKLQQQDLIAPAAASAVEAGAGAGADAVHPQDRVYSGMFGSGRVIELLKNPDGYAYGYRVAFENGMEAQLLITEVPVRH